MIKKILILILLFSVSGYAQQRDYRIRFVKVAYGAERSGRTGGQRYIVRVQKGQIIAAGLSDQPVKYRTTFSVQYAGGGSELTEVRSGMLTWTGTALCDCDYYFTIAVKRRSLFKFRVSAR